MPRTLAEVDADLAKLEACFDTLNDHVKAIKAAMEAHNDAATQNPTVQPPRGLVGRTHVC